MTRSCSSKLSLGFNGVVELLVDHDSTHVEVIVGSRRTVDNDRTTDTSAVLSDGMGVIPTSTIG